MAGNCFRRYLVLLVVKVISEVAVSFKSNNAFRATCLVG